MSNVFISYKREQREWVAKLVNLLETHGFTVWWDPKINVGEEYFHKINDVIAKVDCILVVWSDDSVNSKWVLSEASIGMERKNIVPILKDDVTPPLPFNIFQNANLIDWDGDSKHKGFQELLKSIQKYCASSCENEAREISLEKNENNSTVKTTIETTQDNVNEQWEKVLKLNNTRAYKQYLKNNPKGKHRLKARRKLRGIALKRQIVLFILIIGALAVLIIVKKTGV